MEEEKENLVLPEVKEIESAKSQLVLGLRLLSYSGRNLFDQGTLIYEINVAKCLDAPRELSEESQKLYREVVIQVFKEKDLPLNEDGQASMDDIINAIDVDFNMHSVEEPTEKSTSGRETPGRRFLGGEYEDSSESRQGSFVESGNKQKGELRNTSFMQGSGESSLESRQGSSVEIGKNERGALSSSVPEVYRISIIQQGDKALLEKLARKYFLPHLTDNAKLADRNKLIDVASSLLLKDPARNIQIEAVLRGNNPNQRKIDEVNRLMIDIRTRFDSKQDAKAEAEREEKKTQSKFAWFDENTWEKNEQYLLEKFDRALAEYTSSIVNNTGAKDSNKAALIEAGVELVQGHGNQQQALIEIKAKLSDSILAQGDQSLAIAVQEGINEQYLLEKFGRALGEYTSSIVNNTGAKDSNKAALIEAGVELVQGHGNQQQALFEIEAKLSDSILAQGDQSLAIAVQEGIMEKLEGGSSYRK